jgi:hypothetical protein
MVPEKLRSLRLFRYPKHAAGTWTGRTLIDPAKVVAAVHRHAAKRVKKVGKTAEARAANDEPDYASRRGHFVAAPPAHVNATKAAFLEALKTGGIAQAPEGEVRRCFDSDLAVDLRSLSPERERQLLARGMREASKLHYVTSGAGLWSRGGGQVKALIPLNLSRLISPAQFERLAQANALVNAKTPADVLFMAGRDVQLGQTVEGVAQTVVSDAVNEIEAILKPAREHPDALNALAMKLVEVAVASQRSGAYISFDVWTSEQTHRPIADYLDRFKASFEEIRFSDDPTVQAGIVGALQVYFAHARRLKDTQLFGYQVGLPAFDAKTGDPVAGTPLIGEGAGRAKTYLDESGRSAELLERGQTMWMFQNIEVMDDLLLRLGAHAEAQKPVSVTLVPQQEGYAGGNPFLVDGELQLLEQSSLAKELAEGNLFFNANTLIQPLDAAPPNRLGFEYKTNNTQARVKQNAGDITLELPTAGIGGRIGIEYENFKTYGDYRDNGLALLSTYERLWARDLAPGFDAPGDWMKSER